MKKSRFTEPQIVGILKEHEAGEATKEICRRHGISPATFYSWKAKFGGMEVSDIAKMRALETKTGASNASLPIKPSTSMP